jgi:hypothetical protein
MNLCGEHKVAGDLGSLLIDDHHLHACAFRLILSDHGGSIFKLESLYLLEGRFGIRRRHHGPPDS